MPNATASAQIDFAPVIAAILADAPMPMTFWLATYGPRCGMVLMGINRRHPDRATADNESPEEIMNTKDFWAAARSGSTPAEINAEIYRRADRLRHRCHAA